jgi:hypothetical protein
VLPILLQLEGPRDRMEARQRMDADSLPTDVRAASATSANRVVDATSLCDVSLGSLLRHGQRPNVLMQCSDVPVMAAVAALAGLCVHPFRMCLLPGALDLPEWQHGTLLIGDVSRLTQRQQIAMYDWMDRAETRVQIVSMTSVRLLPLVESGRFLEGLFYRLNVVSMTAGRRNG